MKIYSVDDYELALLGDVKDIEEAKKVAIKNWREVDEDEAELQYITSDGSIFNVSCEREVKVKVKVIAELVQLEEEA